MRVEKRGTSDECHLKGVSSMEWDLRGGRPVLSETRDEYYLKGVRIERSGTRGVRLERSGTSQKFDFLRGMGHKSIETTEVGL